MQKIILIALLLLPFGELFAQKTDKTVDKLEKYRQENWPPVRSYSKISLGYALQQKFKLHAQYCGFGVSGANRDYVPNDITRFLGGRTLRTKVETADIRGGGLLYYIFHEQELSQPLQMTNFQPTRVLQLDELRDQFAINPDENFDTFILTKTCGSYLKAALDAGVEPPYTAFKAALDTDSRRESSVLALAGSFVSPLKLVLDANNELTAEALMKLWKFYIDNPHYINKAYYMREFEGVLVRHITSAEENRRIAMEGGIDLNGPLPVRLKTSFGVGKRSATTFAGVDWETIVYADFEERSSTREKLFNKLPSPEFIRRYFEQIRPVFQKSRDFPVMTEGFEHKHFLVLEGVPENMTANFWEIESVQPGVYDGMPNLKAEFFKDTKEGSSGCRFVISGKPLRSNFEGTTATRPSRLPLVYTIRSRYPVGGEYIRFRINEEIQTSTHPIATVGAGEFDLNRKENRQFSFQWRFEVDVEDIYNPVDFNEKPYIGNLTVRRSDRNLNVRLAKIEPDAQRRKYMITIETLDAFPLEKVDDVNMQPYNLSFDIHLRSRISNNISVRPLHGTLYFPSVRQEVPRETALPVIDDQE